MPSWTDPWPWLAALLGGTGGYWAGRWAEHQRSREKVQTLRQALTSMENANRGLQNAMNSLEQAAGSDRLTGAWNRRRFEEAAVGEMALARRRDIPLSLLILDLDHFKRVNDTFGHETGDAVLAGASHAWKSALRVSDPLVRWGGEEFIVMTPSNGLDGALVLAAKLLEATRALKFPGIPQVTVSIGVAEFVPGESLQAWVQRADLALYRAKAEGRDRAVAAEPPLVDARTPQGQIHPILEIPWEEGYACGHPIIDGQHRMVFTLANGLLASLTLARPLEEVALQWNRLLAHTAQHFHDEEQILQKAGFPLLAHHALEHQQLLTKAKALNEGVLSGTVDLGKVVNFLAMDLIRGHLMNEDAIYFRDVVAHDPGRLP